MPPTSTATRAHSPVGSDGLVHVHQGGREIRVGEVVANGPHSVDSAASAVSGSASTVSEAAVAAPR